MKKRRFKIMSIILAITLIFGTMSAYAQEENSSANNLELTENDNVQTETIEDEIPAILNQVEYDAYNKAVIDSSKISSKITMNKQKQEQLIKENQEQPVVYKSASDPEEYTALQQLEELKKEETDLNQQYNQLQTKLEEMNSVPDKEELKQFPLGTVNTDTEENAITPFSDMGFDPEDSMDKFRDVFNITSFYVDVCYKNKYYEAAVIDVRDKTDKLRLGEKMFCDMTGAIRDANDGKRLVETTIRVVGTEVIGIALSSLPVVGGVFSFTIGAIDAFIPSLVPQQLVCDGNAYLIENTNTLVQRYVYISVGGKWELANSVSYVTVYQDHVVHYIKESSGVTGVKPEVRRTERVIEYRGRYYEAASDAIVDYFTANDPDSIYFPIGRPAVKAIKISSYYNNKQTKTYTHNVAFSRLPGHLINYAMK